MPILPSPKNCRRKFQIGSGCASCGSNVENEQVPFLDCELDVAYISIVSLQAVSYFQKATIDPRHLPLPEIAT